MRILVVTESFHPGVNGVARCTGRVVDHLLARGHDVLVLAPHPGRSQHDGPAGASARVVRVPAVPLPLCRDFPVGVPVPGLADRVTRFDPDVAYLGSPVGLGAWGAAVAQRLGLPTVAVFQTDLAGFATQYGLGPIASPLWWWLARTHRDATRTLAPSRPCVRDLRRRGLDRLHRWPRGVDADQFSPEHRTRAPTAEVGSVRVGYVGRLAREKRVERLGHAAVVPGSHLRVVGDGPARGRLERRLPGARFTGRLRGAALGREYANLDVFVHTGTNETFCQAIQEAMAAGVPVIAPASGGPLDLVEHEVTGLLWRPDQPEAIRDLVRRLVAEPATRQAMGRRAREAVLDRTWEAVGDQLITHLRAAIAEHATPTPIRHRAA